MGQLAPLSGIHASGEAAILPKIKYDREQKSITLRARIIDKIKNVSEPLPPAGLHTTREGQRLLSNRLMAWYDSALRIFPMSTRTTYPTKEPFNPNVIARTLTANISLTGSPLSEELLFATYQTWLTLMRAWSSGSPANIITFETKERTFAAEQFGVLLTTAMGGRVMMASDRSYAGLVPIGALKGDLVAIISGASTPFILRSKGDGYILVGECYVHGIMHGEGLKLGDEVDITLY